MASVSGVFNQQQGASQALASATPLAGKSATSSTSGKTTSTTTSTTSSVGTITSNDFLTLLVTELKNQDPTSTADPNEYVNQLCAVNSLEQLVTINSTLTKDLGTTTTATKAKSGASAETTTSNSTTAQAQAAYHANSLADQSTAANSGSSAVSAIAAKLAPGNLSVPATNSSALRVGQSLSGLSQLQ